MTLCVGARSAFLTGLNDNSFDCVPAERDCAFFLHSLPEVFEVLAGDMDGTDIVFGGGAVTRAVEGDGEEFQQIGVSHGRGIFI